MAWCRPIGIVWLFGETSNDLLCYPLLATFWKMRVFLIYHFFSKSLVNPNVDIRSRHKWTFSVLFSLASEVWLKASHKRDTRSLYRVDTSHCYLYVRTQCTHSMIRLADRSSLGICTHLMVHLNSLNWSSKCEPGIEPQVWSRETMNFGRHGEKTFVPVFPAHFPKQLENDWDCSDLLYHVIT